MESAIRPREWFVSPSFYPSSAGKYIADDCKSVIGVELQVRRDLLITAHLLAKNLQLARGSDDVPFSPTVVLPELLKIVGGVLLYGLPDYRSAGAAGPSLSLGAPSVHDISTRLRAAAQHGFHGVEIIDTDVDATAEKLAAGLTYENRLEAAKNIRRHCDELGLTVIVFQPFRQYEGLLDRKKHEDMIEKLRLWFDIVRVLGSDMIQVPTSWLQEGTTGNKETLVADLREMADMGLAERPVVRFAYEGVAWGRYIDTWEGTWEMAKKVDRPNFGLCLDTFHIAGRVWGDPTAPTGRTGDADCALEASLQRLIKEVDVEKVFYVQAGDAEKLDPPLSRSHPFYAVDQPARMSWSRNARLFPYEEEKGGCLPIEPVMKAIVDGLGYDGWVSMELFSRELSQSDPELPIRYAARASASWRQMTAALKQ